MSIKPIDMQVMMPKTSEVSKIHNDEQHKGYMQGQQQAENIRNKAELDLNRISGRENIKEAKIKEKQEKEKENRKKENKKSKSNYNENSKKDLNDDINTSFIDIRL